MQNGKRALNQERAVQVEKTSPRENCRREAFCLLTVSFKWSELPSLTARLQKKLHCDQTRGSRFFHWTWNEKYFWFLQAPADAR